MAPNLKYQALILIALAARCLAKVPTGLNLPRLDVGSPNYGGSWAEASSLVFVDLFKHSTVFVAQQRGNGPNDAWGWAGNEYFPWTPDGYPANLTPPSKGTWRNYCAMAKVGEKAAYYRAGPYILFYDGVGNVSLAGDAVATTYAPGRVELTLTPASGFFVRVVATDPNNTLHNIRIIPRELEATYATQVFHPTFLDHVSGFSILRFAAWQMASWDPNNPNQKPRSWIRRTTPANQTQITSDGVAVEHMVQLANKVGASPWFSLPAGVDDDDTYLAGFAKFVAENLAEGLNVYIEFGIEAPGWMDTRQADQTLRIARIWRSMWSSLGKDPNRLTVVAAAPHTGVPWYIYDRFGTSIKEVNAISMSGSYGSIKSWSYNFKCHYDFLSSQFPQENANITQERVTELARSAVLHADLTLNKFFNQAKAKSLRFLAYSGGPDMRALDYGARANYQTLLGCNTYPCSRYMFPPVGKQVTFNTEAEMSDAKQTYRDQAQNEYNLEELLMKYKLDVDATRNHVLDSLWRWESMGGGEFVVSLPSPTFCDSGPGTSAMKTKECLAGGNAHVSPETSPIYQAVRDYQAGTRSALARHSGEAAPPPAPAKCDPACVWGTCLKGKCECYAGYRGANCSELGVKPNDCNKVVGVNLEGLSDYAHSWTFLDLMKLGRTWLSQGHDGSGGWGNTTGVKTDESGYPISLGTLQTAGTFVNRDLGGHFPGGTFTVLYDGEGLLDFSMDVTSVRYIQAGKVEVDVTPSTLGNNGLYVTVSRTNPANPIRNIQVLVPGYDEQDVAAVPFHPRLLSFMRGYTAIRFMDWMATGSSNLPKTWSERPKTTDRSYASNRGGVPVEVMVKLANLVGASPWFSLPHTADDDYHRNFAAMVKATLRPDVKVYVEWSNEVWHTGFVGGQYAQSEGTRLQMNEEGAQWPGGANNEARLCYYSERTKQMSRIWKEVFGTQADRVVVVAQGQAVWPITSSKVLSCRNATSHIDALAIATYFGNFNAQRDKVLDTFMQVTLPAQMNETLTNILPPHEAIARRFGKPLLAYEAGSGMGGWEDLPKQANRDPRMKGIYETYLHGLQNGNVSLVMHYSSVTAYSQYGSWGLMEWMDQDPQTAPKLLGVEAFISSGSVGTSMCSILPDSNSTGEMPFIEHKENCGYYCTFEQGTCDTISKVEGRERYWSCSCGEQYSGIQCSRFSCPNNCSWAGTCLDTGICSCYPGFMGDHCQTNCKCNGHGTCTKDGSCICDVGYKLGPNGCEFDCNCLDGATCIGPGECGCVSGCRYGTCFHGRCHCWAGYTGSTCTTATTAPNANSTIGMNIAGVAYWQSQWVWVDVMKQSSNWWTANLPDTSLVNPFDTNDTLALRPDGYPASLPPNKLAHKLTVRNVQLKAMPGRYVALYDGEGTIEVEFDAKVVSVAKGRVEFDFVPTANMECHERGMAYCGDNGIHFRVMATNPANPIRNVRLLMPGFEASAGRQPFHPWFLKSLERYSVLRFMEWMDTGAATLAPWAARTTPSHDTQARPGGVALEHIIDLCNQLGAAPWITVHHLANDTYVTNLATLLKTLLRPDLKIYVEHSNEVWNVGFEQGKYAGKKGLELKLATDETTARYRYHALRSQQIFDIFTRVFGATARTTRLRYAIGTWGFVCNGGTGCGVQAMEETLSYKNTSTKADVVAITGYFDCGLGANAYKDMLLTQDQMIEQCKASLNGSQAMIQRLKEIAQKYNKTVTTYEAGPSIVEASAIQGGGVTPNAAQRYIALQRDPRFMDIYSQYLAMFDSLGLVGRDTPFMQYNSAGLPSQYGSWGLLEYTGQDPATAPKYQAIKAVLDNKQGQINVPGCMTANLGYRALGDNSYYGLPAVMAPARGAVWIQGYSYDITWPRPYAPTGTLNISIYSTTNCGATAKPLFVYANKLVTLTPTSASLTVAAPTTVNAAGLFLEIKDVNTGRKDFSELFSILPKYLAIASAWGSCTANCAGLLPGNKTTGKQTRTVSCIVHPELPPTATLPQLQPFCSSLPWNLTKIGTGDNVCSFEPNGCRNYRTGRKDVNWYSTFKPITDCSAQYSPKPSAAALAAAGIVVGPFIPGAPANVTLCPKPLPATERACTLVC